MSDSGEQTGESVWTDPDLVRGIVETSPVGITVVAADGTVTFANERAQEIYGRSSEEIDEFSHDDPRWDLVDENGDPLETGEAPFDRVVAREKPVYDQVVGLRRPSGERVWVSVNGAPQWTAEGELDRAVFAFEDVTERKARERALQQKERRYEAIFEDPNILVGLLEPDGTVLDINQTAMEYTEADLDEVTGEPFWDTPWWGGRDDMREDVREWTEQASRGEYVNFETQLVGPDGERYTLNGYFRPVTNEDGDVVSIIVSDRDITERKKRERELEESERRYRALVEHFPNGAVALVDEDLHYQTVGGSPLDVADVTVEETEGEQVREALPPDLADELVPRYRAAIEEGTTSTFESESNGRTFWFHVVPVRDDAGEVFAALGMSQDITERRESKRRYRTLVENFPNGAVGLFDDDLRYTVAGGDVLETVGTSEAEIVGKTVWERYPENLAAQFEPNFRAALEGERNSFEIEFHGRHWVAYTLPVENETGDIYAGMVMVQDITELKERERELERALDLLNKTERIADVAGWEVDPQTGEPYWCDHLFDLLDVSYDDQPTLEQALDVYHTEADQAMVEDAVQTALETGEPFDVEARFPRPGGDVGWLRVQGDPEVVDGEVVTLRGAVQDVTERKRRERRLEELVEQLEASNERLEQFAYAASHDLQEPLRMVSSYLGLIQSRYADELDEDAEEFIDYAVDGADRMREMIQGLLEYSRVETRGEPFEPVDLNTVVDDVLTDLQLQIQDNDADVTVGDLPRVRGDGGQLRQVVQNLLDNAIEYSGDEVPQIHVSAERDGPKWRISVRDEGIGIDPDQQERIFDVFQRLHSHEEHAGTGIGLALCERIIERHGGDIRVESDPGEGSTFSFTLPPAEDGGP